MKDKLPVRILEQNGRIKATTSVSQLNSNSGSIRQDMGYIEFDYSVTVKIIEDILKGIKENKGKRVDPRFYWLIGDLVLVFLSRIDSLGYYMVDQNDTLGKSVGLSGSSIRRIIAFRRRFSDIALVDSGIAWSEYRDNKVLY
jgi:ABC-type glycerol-3-phosphate transport system substrate-binding protein